MRYQAMLFDIDGTLTNSLPAFAIVLREVLKKYGKTATDAQIQRLFPLPAEVTAAEFGVSPNGFDQFETDYEDSLARHLDAIELFPGISETLMQLSTTHQLGIVTSQTRSEFDLGMHQYPFTAKLGSVVTADVTAKRKPAPDPLLKAQSDLQVPIESILYVGDSKADEGAADAAGMDFAVATWGADPELTFPTAKYQLKDPQELLTI